MLRARRHQASLHSQMAAQQHISCPSFLAFTSYHVQSMGFWVMNGEC